MGDVYDGRVSTAHLLLLVGPGLEASQHGGQEEGGAGSRQARHVCWQTGRYGTVPPAERRRPYTLAGGAGEDPLGRPQQLHTPTAHSIAN